MRIAITNYLKADGPGTADLPDDFQEEFATPATIEAIASVLRGLGHDVVKLGDGREMLEKLLADPPDFVFNIAEGQGVSRSREARVPAVLEMLGIPYSGSDPLTLAVTLDKDCAKRLVASAGVPTPPGIVLEVKRDFRQQVTYECPAKLPAETVKAIEQAALTSYRALGCRDVSRVDFRVRGGVPYFLEVNPLPGLSPESSDLVLMTVEQQG